MSDARRSLAIRRLLVGLDTSRPGLAALAEAARLAARLDAELAGLFVEDEDLIALAALPCTRFVDPSSASLRRANPGEMERELRVASTRARTALEDVARREHVRWSFRTVRGRASTRLLEAAGEADLVLIGRSRWARGSARRAGSTARRVATRSSRTVLVLGGGQRVTDPVVAVFTGTAESRRALEAAAQLARQDGGRLVVLLAASALGEASSREALLDELARAGDLTVTSRELPDLTAEAVAEAVESTGGRLLVLPSDACEDRPGELEAVLDRVGGAILLIR